MTKPLRFQGKIMRAWISERASDWFVRITVQIPELGQSRPPRMFGVEIGVKSLVVDSESEVFENQKHLAHAQKKRWRLNRWLARKQKGSQNWGKAQRKLARLYLRITNLRADAIHKLTTRLTAKARSIAQETLNVVGMLKNHKLARAIMDASFAEIARQLTSKTQQVVLVAPFYPSSKTGHRCGSVNSQLPKRKRLGLSLALPARRQLASETDGLLIKARPGEPGSGCRCSASDHEPFTHRRFP